MSRPAVIVAAVYFAVAAGIAIKTAMEPRSVWGGLQHMATFVATAPATFPLAMAGIELDFNNHANVALMILAATGVVYGAVSGISWLISLV